MRPLDATEQRCEGCDVIVAKSGLSRHKKTQACIAVTAQRKLRAQGYSELGWNVSEAREYSIPVVTARTRRHGNTFRSAPWAPGWTDFTLNNWPGARNDREHPELLRAFIKKLLDDPESTRAYDVVFKQWIESTPPPGKQALVDFARAVVGTVEADAEVSTALEALYRALIKRVY